MLRKYFLSQESLSDETRLKLALSNKLKDSDAELNRLQDQLDDEEDAKVALQKNLSQVQAQVSQWRIFFYWIISWKSLKIYYWMYVWLKCRFNFVLCNLDC